MSFCGYHTFFFLFVGNRLTWILQNLQPPHLILVKKELSVNFCISFLFLQDLRWTPNNVKLTFLSVCSAGHENLCLDLFSVKTLVYSWSIRSDVSLSPLCKALLVRSSLCDEQVKVQKHVFFLNRQSCFLTLITLRFHI